MELTESVNIPKFKHGHQDTKIDSTLERLNKSKITIEQKISKPLLRKDHKTDLTNQLENQNEEEEQVINKIKINTKVFFSYASKFRKYKCKIGPLKSGHTFESGPKKMAKYDQFQVMF